MEIVAIENYEALVASLAMYVGGTLELAGPDASIAVNDLLRFSRRVAGVPTSKMHPPFDEIVVFQDGTVHASQEIFFSGLRAASQLPALFSWPINFVSPVLSALHFFGSRKLSRLRNAGDAEATLIRILEISKTKSILAIVRFNNINGPLESVLLHAVKKLPNLTVLSDHPGNADATVRLDVTYADPDARRSVEQEQILQFLGDDGDRIRAALTRQHDRQATTFELLTTPLVLQRLENLGNDKRILETAAAFGMSFDAETIARAAGRQVDEVESVLLSLTPLVVVRSEDLCELSESTSSKARFRWVNRHFREVLVASSPDPKCDPARLLEISQKVRGLSAVGAQEMEEIAVVCGEEQLALHYRTVAHNQLTLDSYLTAMLSIMELHVVDSTLTGTEEARALLEAASFAWGGAEQELANEALSLARKLFRSYDLKEEVEYSGFIRASEHLASGFVANDFALCDALESVAIVRAKMADGGINARLFTLAYCQLSRTLVNLGYSEEAAAGSHRAIQTSAELPLLSQSQLLGELGFAQFFALNDPDSAQRSFVGALELMDRSIQESPDVIVPEQPMFHYLLGRSYLAMGDVTKATSLFLSAREAGSRERNLHQSGHSTAWLSVRRIGGRYRIGLALHLGGGDYLSFGGLNRTLRR
jgi:hypothetical protein